MGLPRCLDWLCRASRRGAYIAYAPGIGEQMAWVLYHELMRSNVPAYLDLNDLEPSLQSRTEQALRAINRHRYFVLVLNCQECLLKLREDNSALGKHVLHALRTRRVIVPFFPEDLKLSAIPNDFAELKDRVPVTYVAEHFTIALDQLKGKIKGKR